MSKLQDALKRSRSATKAYNGGHLQVVKLTNCWQLVVFPDFPEVRQAVLAARRRQGDDGVVVIRKYEGMRAAPFFSSFEELREAALEIDPLFDADYWEAAI